MAHVSPPSICAMTRAIPVPTIPCTAAFPVEQWLHRFYHKGNCLALPSAMVRMSVLRQTELMDPTLFQCGDWDLWV
jgi:hypothetical protein